jgi:hypothetical protein
MFLRNFGDVDYGVTSQNTVDVLFKIILGNENVRVFCPIIGVQWGPLLTQ